MPISFEWDEAKARNNAKKHGVSFEEAASAFADGLGVIFSDEEHPNGEIARFLSDTRL